MKLFLLSLLLLAAPHSVVDAAFFARTATYYICENGSGCTTDDETVAEIVTASTDGNTLLYTNSAMNSLGMVDIAADGAPTGMGEIALEGEPTSVGVVNAQYAVVAVNTSPDFVNVTGQAVVVDVTSKSIVRVMEIGGQPDSVAVSPDGTFVAIAIENERDEDLGDGRVPQLPAGFLVVLRTAAEAPADWTMDTVELTGLDILYPTDPEPEYVAINQDNICVVTLQENNAAVLVDLTTLEIVSSYDLGSPLITNVDVVEDGIIQQSGTVQVPREPDAVTWISNEYFATANEGDMDGGSRGFSIFAIDGSAVYDSAQTMEWQTVRVGHYPEERSENKGNEPEGILYAEFGDVPYLFVLSERSSLVFVYTVEDVTAPVLKQILPTQLAPEGIVAIPERNLLVVASENDERAAKFRSALNIYTLGESNEYPTLVSGPIDGDAANPYIPFAALSGLSADPDDDVTLYAVEDSFFKSSRMFVIDTSAMPAVITDGIRLTDTNGVLADAIASLDGTSLAVNMTATPLINDDATVNLDLEGIAKTSDGASFWIVSEGSGTYNDTERPYAFPNLLLQVDDNTGVIGKAVLLPMAINMMQLRFGFEGVAVDGDYVVVAFQRAWNDEDHPRLGIYNTATEEWSFVYYPLDPVSSPNGGWVGLSDISSLGEGKFLVLERDNQGGPDAAIKRLFQINLGDFSMGVMEETGDVAAIERQGTVALPVVEKTLVLDLISPIEQITHAKSAEKWEGLAVTSSGDVWIVNDNDGVDDNSGEIQLLNIGSLEAMMEMEGGENVPVVESTGGDSGAVGVASSSGVVSLVAMMVFALAAVV